MKSVRDESRHDQGNFRGRGIMIPKVKDLSLEVNLHDAKSSFEKNC